ncbi:Golgin candidate 4 [Phytophthora citrophthora]|uniref:Golgin candidate 4 n=1 Tax=Phytophthora citrophthora TaxID=4793 RepID=A0AAD9G2Z6_9STRA|nr:Golgin candidate 4 [Phytophthora citrophthora]
MWSRLTEGLADIVAPEEGGEDERNDEDPLWNRFSAVVAPPPLSPAPTPSAAPASEDDEQEQYICELERALLQRKKQNETLEQKIKELESRAGDERQLKRHVKEQEMEIAQQKAVIERLQAARNEAVVLQSDEGQSSGSDRDLLVQELQQSQAEADSLAVQCQAHEKELVSLRDRVEELQAANETLLEDEREARSRAAEYEQGYVDLLAEIEKMKTTNEEEKAALVAKSEEHASSIDSQKLYDLEARLTTSEADKAIAQQDAERLQRDLNALEGILHQFQVENKAHKERVAAMEVELEQVKTELQTRQPLPEPTEGETNDLERVMEKLANKTRECEQLREVKGGFVALECTATQYNSERDVLDKRLASELVVAYVDSNKKGEVLQLMARMMGFTEEQKRRVGLGYPIEGNGGGGLFSSIIGLVAPEGGGVPVDSSAIEGKSFADMWSEFLLDEANKGKSSS